MLGERRIEDQLFSYIPLEERVPADHPLRVACAFVDPILKELLPRVEVIYSSEATPSILREHLLRALLIQVLYSVRSERMLCDRLEYNLHSSGRRVWGWTTGVNADDV